VEWTTAGDGGVFGFLNGAQQSSLVINVLAGQACLAR